MQPCIFCSYFKYLNLGTQFNNQLVKNGDSNALFYRIISVFDILLMLSVPYIEFHSSLRLTTSSIELVFQ